MKKYIRPLLESEILKDNLHLLIQLRGLCTVCIIKASLKYGKIISNVIDTPEFAKYFIKSINACLSNRPPLFPQITFICPMVFNNFPLDTQVKRRGGERKSFVSLLRETERGAFELSSNFLSDEFPTSVKDAFLSLFNLSCLSFPQTISLEF